MTKKAPIDRLRDISKRRSIRQPPVIDPTLEGRFSGTMPVEWPIVGSTDGID